MFFFWLLGILNHFWESRVFLIQWPWPDIHILNWQGLIHEVFTTILRGLSGAKVTRPGKFRSCQDGYAVKSSLKAEDGVLYPLEKSFFFLPKPPTLILHEEVYSLYLSLLYDTIMVLTKYGAYWRLHRGWPICLSSRLITWNFRGMPLVAQICITLIFLSDLKPSKNIFSEIFRETSTIIFLTSWGQSELLISFNGDNDWSLLI